jgi:hypothetical protein
MKWEYVVTGDETQLPNLGREGWELVAVVPRAGGLSFYLKKPAPGLKERITLEQRREVYRQKGGEAT